MVGRFNVFQAAMLRWRSLYPYNAVHVVAVPAPLDKPRLAQLIAQTLETAGLTGYVLDAARRRFAFAGGPTTVEVATVDSGSDPAGALYRRIEEEINHRFPADGRFDPFRFFVVTDGAGFRLGLGYDHPLAGGDSIAALLTGIAERYARGPERGGAPEPAPGPAALDRYPATYGALLRRDPGGCLRAFAEIPAQIALGRRAVRPPRGKAGDGSNGFLRLGVGREQLRCMRLKAEQWGVSVSDLVVSLVLASVSTLVPDRRSAPRRNTVAVATIVNLRSQFQPGPERTFGQFLSSYRVFHPVPEGTPLEQLARDVHVQTRRARRTRLYLLTLLTLGIAGLVWPFLDQNRKQRLFFKYHPVLAGVTGLNVNPLRRSGRSADGDYLRAASTGPLAPMVFATTSSGEAMEIGITYRTSILSREAAESVGKAFESWMESLQ